MGKYENTLSLISVNYNRISYVMNRKGRLTLKARDGAEVSLECFWPNDAQKSLMCLLKENVPSGLIQSSESWWVRPSAVMRVERGPNWLTVLMGDHEYSLKIRGPESHVIKVEKSLEGLV